MEDTGFHLLRKQVENEAGQTVSKGQEVVVHVQREGQTALKYSGVIGREDFSPALQSVLVGMRQGEKWVVQDESKATLTVELSEVGKTVDGRSHLEVADALKAVGNGFIKARQNTKAAVSYTQAYNLLINDPSAKAQELKLSIVSNLALATLNQGDFKSAIEWCDLHLQQTVEPNVKVVFRRASAHKGLKNWTETRADIAFGIENSKGDDESISNFNKLLSQMQKEEKEQKAKEKAVYGKMFN